MSIDTENFEELRRLLKIKRHEQPPPGYFNGFSHQVIARIKLGERGDMDGVMDRLFWEAPWLQRFWAAFESKPILAGAFGAAVCGSLIAGVIYSGKADAQPVALIPMTESVSDSVAVARVMDANHPLLARPAATDASSTSPIAALQGDAPWLGGVRPQPVNWAVPNGN